MDWVAVVVAVRPTETVEDAVAAAPEMAAADHSDRHQSGPRS